RTLEWTVDSPVPEETFTPMPIVEDYDPLWQAKLQGKPMKTTDNHRASPIARDTIIPFVMTMILGLFSIFMMYHWYILAAITGAGVFVCFIIRALADERNDYYGERGRSKMNTDEQSLFRDKQIGFLIYLGVESIMFLTLFATYFIFTPSSEGPHPSEIFSVTTVVLSSVFLLSSSGT